MHGKQERQMWLQPCAGQQQQAVPLPRLINSFYIPGLLCRLHPKSHPQAPPLSKSEVAASTHTALLLDFRASQHPALRSVSIILCQAPAFLSQVGLCKPSHPLRLCSTPLLPSPGPKACLSPDSFQHVQAYSLALSSCSRSDVLLRPSTLETEATAALPRHPAHSELTCQEENMCPLTIKSDRQKPLPVAWRRLALSGRAVPKLQ